MASRCFIFIIIFALSFNVFAGKDCFMQKAFDNKALRDNEDFWNEVAQLSESKKLSKASFDDLLQKYTSKTQQDLPAPLMGVGNSRVGQIAIETSKAADKELAKLPKDIVRKYEEFVTQAISEEGIQGFYKNPGRWHFEKLTGTNSYTVRLNKGIRVHFTNESGKLRIIQVNADHVHDHL